MPAGVAVGVGVGVTVGDGSAVEVGVGEGGVGVQVEVRIKGAVVGLSVAAAVGWSSAEQPTTSHVVKRIKMT